jgi:hypothetical protein
MSAEIIFLFFFVF